MEFKKAFISELKPAKYNPRKDLTDQDPEYLRIKRSIEEFGYVDPVIVNADYTVIGGHQRIKVLRDLGHASIDVVVVDIPKIKEKALNIALNKITGEWDTQRLTDLLGELKTGGFDISITGFDEKEFDGLLRELHKDDEPLDSEPQISRAEELRKEWGTELGQMWQCGEHRVICGDCTDPEVVARLLRSGTPAAEVPQLMVTDPPYGVNYDPEWRVEQSGHTQKTHGKIIEGDDRCDWTPAWDLFKGDVAYVWHAGAHSHEVAGSLIAVGMIPAYLIIWNKNPAVFGRGDYHHKHEPCWYVVRKGANHHWAGDRKQNTVWDIDTITSFKNGKDVESWGIVGHGNQKPMECMLRPIRNHQSDLVYDPFLGSGTTMIACENLGRKCRGCEIDPGYIAVILQRYKDTFPDKEIRLIADNAGA